MKIKYIVLVALAALALGVASLGVTAPPIAGGRTGSSGEVYTDVGAPALAAGNAGAGGGDVRADVGGRGGIGGDVRADVGAPDVASIKPGTGDFEAEVATPRYTVSGAKLGIASGSN